MSWNKHEAVSYARSHALTHTGHYCARAIAAAIRAGGLKIEGANLSPTPASRNLIQALLK
jgi:hypothetical protein